MSESQAVVYHELKLFHVTVGGLNAGSIYQPIS